MAETANKNTSKPVSKTKDSDFLDERKSSRESDLIELAEAIGSGIAKKLNNLQNTNPTNAATASLEISRRANDLGEKQREFAEFIAKDKENYVAVMIPTLYKQYIPVLPIYLNGCMVNIPVDGVTRMVHKLYATEIYNRLRYIDEKVLNMQNKGSIKEVRSFA